MSWARLLEVPDEQDPDRGEGDEGGRQQAADSEPQSGSGLGLFGEDLTQPAAMRFAVGSAALPGSIWESGSSWLMTPIGRGPRPIPRPRGSGSSRSPDLQPMVHLGHVVAEPEDHLHAREVDPQVALEARDHPDPADLGGLVAFRLAVVGELDQAQPLVADEGPRARSPVAGRRGREGRCVASYPVEPCRDPGCLGSLVMGSPQAGAGVLLVALARTAGSAACLRRRRPGHDDLELHEQVALGLPSRGRDALPLEPELHAAGTPGGIESDSCRRARGRRSWRRGPPRGR